MANEDRKAFNAMLLAKRSGADFTEPITAGIFVSIAAWASFQRKDDETPYWRSRKNIRYFVKDYENVLFELD